MTTAQRAANPLRLVNMQHDALHNDHTEPTNNGFSDIISQDDPRWMFATRVQLIFNGTNRIRSIGQLEDLLECARGYGFSDMHARAIVCIVEEAQFRNGLDTIAMDELLDIPSPGAENELSDRTRWITFGVLFTWSLMIAGLMQLV